MKTVLGNKLLRKMSGELHGYTVQQQYPSL